MFRFSPIELEQSDLIVKVGSAVLSADEYEIVSYQNNIEKGTAKVTIRGVGENYGGTKTVSFKIAQRSMGVTIRFMPNGATAGSMSDQIIYKDAALTKNKFKRVIDKKNIGFLGWNSKPDGSGDWYDDAKKLSYELYDSGTIITLYAIWEDMEIPEVDPVDIALITDAKSVDDKGFNQYSWEGIRQYAADSGVNANYYVPAEQTTEQYMTQIETAVKNGAMVVICPGFLFGDSISQAQELYPDVRFICIDFEPYTELSDNTVAVYFDEEEAGFLAGYAAVKEGFRSLGFDGAMAVPAVKNYGYGYLYGAEYAAKELGLAQDEVTVKYSYTGEFAEREEYVTNDMNWFSEGVEVILGCGSSRNAFEAAARFNAASDHTVWAIGVDTNCADENEYVLTSAMKNLGPVVYKLVKSAYETDFPEGGSVLHCNITDDAVALPMSDSRFTNFSQADYNAITDTLKNNETLRTSIPTGYGNGTNYDYVSVQDLVDTLENITVEVFDD